MAQTERLITALKRALKAKGITYADIAQQLALSESSIKRLFAEQSFSLERLEQICQLADLEISDLVQLMLEESRHIEMLSEEQEHEIASDIKLLLVAICVLHRWSYDDLLKHYKLTPTECIRLLAKLDKLKIIELLPKNRVRVIVSKNFRWRANGPIQQFFKSTVQPDFFNSEFQQAGENLIFRSGMLSKGSHAILMKKLERLAAEFSELHDTDVGQPLAERFGTSIVLAVRAWEFGPFKKLRRDPNEKPFTVN